MHRFYAEKVLNGQAFLSQEDERHARRVLRLVPGSEAEIIFDGLRYQAMMRNDSVFELGHVLPSTEASLRITLFQGLPKGDKMDFIVQKAVEIGVDRIVPVLMERCVVRLSASDLEKKQARWTRIAREAGKQSGRCLLPEVTLPCQLRGIPALAEKLDACAVPWEEETAMGPLAFCSAHPKLSSLGILIGPEGGISPEEIMLIRPCFEPLTLGPRILRTETAGLVATSVFLSAFGEMEGC